MQLFKNIEGKFNSAYGDDVIQLRFKCSKKKNEHSNGELAILLKALKLSENNSYMWDVKKSLWQALGIQIIPVQLSKERNTIFLRKINNAGDIQILRNQEGEKLLKALRLPISTTKKDVEIAIIERVQSINQS